MKFSIIAFFYPLALAWLLVGGHASPVEMPGPPGVQDHRNILKDSPVYVADPFVLHANGLYYLYGTSGSAADKGIPVYTSTDLIHWKGPLGAAGDGLALIKGQTFGDKGFWAPFVLQQNNKFYMYYTANEEIAVAVSDSPLGPFVQKTFTSMHPGIKEIDPHVFVDDNGKKYLYMVRLQNGNRIFGAELNNDLVSIKQSTLQPCISQSQPWEIASGSQWPVTEAPAVLKYKGLYYMFYTANDFRHPDYNVGYAVSQNPLGPWKKNEDNPIIPKTRGIQGTGHCELIRSAAGEWLMFYHTHYSTDKVSPRRTAFSRISFRADGSSYKPVVDTLKQFCYY
jgi:xylan 1,4-beta-xylosidase